MALTRRTLLQATAAALGAALPERRVRAAARRPTPARSLDLDAFVADCAAAGREADTQSAVQEVLARAIADPRAVLAALGEPGQAGIRPLHRSKTLTVFSATWTPQMNLMPHNHLMWALIGIYTGREDNILWRPAPGRIEAFGAKALFEGDVVALNADVIHSVTNPLPRFTGGIHIYGGDFFDTSRSQWNPETLHEEPSDGVTIRQMFERENARRQCSPTDPLIEDSPV
jgi:predicted metal-dependent enzyme (double-stranded beta helix superfamily)